MVRRLSTAGFHRNTSETDWQVGSICQANTDKATQACQRIRTTWVTSVVADKKRGKETVVQELWLFELDSPDDAASAVSSFASEFRYGPFAKHPYRAFVHDRHVVVVEGRARWHTDGRRLEAYIEKSLAKLARQAAD